MLLIYWNQIHSMSLRFKCNSKCDSYSFECFYEKRNVYNIVHLS